MVTGSCHDVGMSGEDYFIMKSYGKSKDQIPVRIVVTVYTDLKWHTLHSTGKSTKYSCVYLLICI